MARRRQPRVTSPSRSTTGCDVPPSSAGRTKIVVPPGSRRNQSTRTECLAGALPCMVIRVCPPRTRVARPPKYQMLATLCHGQISVPGPGSSVVASLVGSVPACAPRSAPDTATEPVIAGDLERRTNRVTSAIVAVPLTAGTTTEMITALSIRPTRLNIQILATLCHWLVAFVPLVVTSPDMERSASIVVRW